MNKLIINPRSALRILSLSIIHFSLFIFLSCSPAVHNKPESIGIVPDTIDAANPWTNLVLNDSPDHFRFAVVSDNTSDPRKGVFSSAMDKLNMMQPEFVLSIGDIIVGYTNDREKLEQEWKEMNGEINKLEMPFFYIPGNHDYYHAHEPMIEIWNEKFGRPFYHFKYRNVLFLCLNSQYKHSNQDAIGDEQVAYAQKVLEENRDVRWTFVVIHRPLWFHPVHNGWDKVEKLLKGRQYTVFAGHFHMYQKTVRQGMNYYTFATTGGGSPLRGPEYGEFDHIVWVTMKKDKPVIANLLLEGILDGDIQDRETADYSWQMTQKDFFFMTPLLTDDGVFRGGKTALTIKNNFETPFEAVCVFEDNPAIRPDMTVFKKRIPGGSDAVVDLELTSVHDTHVDVIPPLKLNLFAKKNIRGKDVSVKWPFLISPQKTFSCTPADQKIIVDGKPDEWKDYPFNITAPAQILFDKKTWLGPQDGTFSFSAVYDNEYLYIAVHTKDDQSFLLENKLPWEQDGIEVRIDARPLYDCANGRGRDGSDDFLAIGLSPDGKGKDYLSQSLEGMKAVCMTMDDGHFTEIRVPATYLNKMQKQKWEHFRLNITVNDFDGENADSQLWWQPDWRTPENRIGSGIFKKTEKKN